MNITFSIQVYKELRAIGCTPKYAIEHARFQKKYWAYR